MKESIRYVSLGDPIQKESLHESIVFLSRSPSSLSCKHSIITVDKTCLGIHCTPKQRV